MSLGAPEGVVFDRPFECGVLICDVGIFFRWGVSSFLDICPVFWLV